MKNLKQFGKRLFSMQFALILLSVLIIVCVFGSIIPQGELESTYMNSYPTSLVHLILALGLDDVFHCWWFAVLTVLLCLNLLGCNLLHAPGLIRAWNKGYTPEKRMNSFKEGETYLIRNDALQLFDKLSFSSPQTIQTPDGRTFLYGVRNKIGIWGAWLTHLGMLIIIVGFALGQIFTVKYTVYGVPGQTKTIEDTDLALTINAFDISLREDETVEQYTADVTLVNLTSGEMESGETSVNHPASLLGMQVYQNSTGWAATVTVYENNEEIQSELLCAGEYLEVSTKPGLYLMFRAFYPDYAKDAGGQPYSASSSLNNPGYLYAVYYNNQVIGMNVLNNDYISIDDYVITFEQPQHYTLIQLKRDPYTWLAAIGGILICLALLIAFYFRTEELWALQNEDGTWTVSGYSKKGGLLFAENLKEAVKDC